MAPRKTKAEFDDELAAVQLETAQLQLEQQRETNADYKAKKADQAAKNAQRQGQLAMDRRTAERRQAHCKHRQGGQPGQEFRGNGPSVLTRSRVFFSDNYVIQCARCDLCMTRPLPIEKKQNPAKYERDMARYNKLFEESESNDLIPMEGPTFLFTNADGMPVIPELR